METVWNSMENVLIWYKIPHCRQPLEKAYHVFEVISKENIHNNLKMFFKYSLLFQTCIWWGKMSYINFNNWQVECRNIFY